MIEKVDFTKSDQYTLTIRVSTDGFSFSIYNPIDHTICFIPYKVNLNISLTANLRTAFQECEFLKYSYKRINVLLANSPVITIPFDIFEDEQVASLYYHDFPELLNRPVLYNILNKSKVVVAYSIEKIIHQLLSEKFPEARYFSSISPLMEYFNEKAMMGNQNKMFLFVQKKQMDIFCFERNRLLFYNSYACSCNEDRLYYILYIWRQLNMDQRRDTLLLCGNIREQKALQEELNKYIQNLFIQHTVPGLASCEDSNTIPFDIQTLLTCAL